MGLLISWMKRSYQAASIFRNSPLRIVPLGIPHRGYENLEDCFAVFLISNIRKFWNLERRWWWYAKERISRAWWFRKDDSLSRILRRKASRNDKFINNYLRNRPCKKLPIQTLDPVRKDQGAILGTILWLTGSLPPHKLNLKAYNQSPAQICGRSKARWFINSISIVTNPVASSRFSQIQRLVCLS